MGDRDLVKPLLEKRGRIFFGRVLMKPGKPLTFATVDKPDGTKLLVFGLPGNPVSSIATWHLTVVPVLRKLAGMRDPSLRRIHVRTVRTRIPSFNATLPVPGFRRPSFNPCLRQ